MDPLTICVTVASLVQTCGTAATTCNGLLGKYKNAPKTLVSIRTECTAIKTTLSFVERLVKQDTKLLSSQLKAYSPLAETLDVALSGCAFTFSILDIELQKLYDRSKDHDGYNWKDKMRYLWDEDRVKNILLHMRGLQSAVNLVLTALQTASISALVSLLQDQKSVIDRVRQDTVSICENRSLQLGLAADANGQASSDNYSIFDSNIGDELFSFDDEIVNSFAYRNALKRLASKTKATQQNAKPDEHHILDEPLIDLERLSETHNGPRLMSTVTSNHHCLTPSKPFTHTARLSDTIMKDLKSPLPSSVASPSQQRNERHADFASPSYDSESPNNTSANQSSKNRAVEEVVGQRVRARAYDETCMLNKPAFAAPLEHSRSTSITADTVEDFDKNATLKTAKRREIFGAGCSDVTRSSMLSENESSSLQGEERQGAESFVEQAAPEEFHIASPSPRVLSLSGNHNSYHRSGARVDLRSTRDEDEAPRDNATDRLPRRKERPVHGRQYYLTSKSEAPKNEDTRIPTPGSSHVVEYDTTSPETDGKYLTSTRKVTSNEVKSSQKTKRNSHQRRHSATKGLFIASHTTTALKHHKREDSSSNHDTRSSLSGQKSRKKRVKDKIQDSRHGAYLIDNSKSRDGDEVRSKSLIEANLRWHESKLEKEELEALKLEQRKTKGGQTLELTHRGLRASPVTSADLAHKSSKDASDTNGFKNPNSNRDQSP